MTVIPIVKQIAYEHHYMEFRNLEFPLVIQSLFLEGWLEIQPTCGEILTFDIRGIKRHFNKLKKHDCESFQK